MKKSNAIFAILAMVIVTIAVTIVSCKKDDAVALSGQSTAKAAFAPPQVDDMNAYLKNFKQKMQSAAKGDDEALSIEEAAWHLSSVANYDFGQINVEFDNVRFDTLYAHVNITNGAVLMSDLGEVYENVHNNIECFFEKLNLQEKHLRFIDAEINEDGFTVISLVTSFKNDSKGWNEHHWFYPPYVADPFSDTTTAYDVCDSCFSEDVDYKWDDFGLTELVRLLNATEHHTLNIFDGTFQPISYYTKTREHTFEYLSNIDPYGSPSNANSRLFGVMGNFNYRIPKMDMCYYLDSYLGLGYHFLSEHPVALYINECPAVWTITTANEVFYPDYSGTYYHKLKVTYCCSSFHNLGTD